MEKTLAKRLRKCRVDKGLSQSKLGDLIDMHYTQVGRYERAEAVPSLEVLKRLAEALDVTVDYLVDGRPEEVAEASLHDRDLLRQFKQLQGFDDEDKHIVKSLIDAFIMKRQIQKMTK